MGKTETFANLNTDLGRLATRVETYLQENGFEVAFSKDQTEPASWFFIQARKAGALRTVAGARRSTDITIRGNPDRIEVSIGTGEWGKNLVTSAPLFIVPVVGITASLVKLYTAKRFEDNLWKFIRDQARFLSGSGTKAVEPQAGTAVDSRAYDCDYIEGYPGWKTQLTGGKLVLFRERGGKNRVVFRSGSQEIAIPAENIAGASIITRKKGLNEDDLMIQLDCEGDGGKSMRLVFNINDGIIRGVMAGIDELAGEDKALRGFEGMSVTTDTKSCSACGASIPREARFCQSCGQKQ
ncbi:MAG: zinc ribbon domain-containing protein [Nitrososphaera sp.]|uniref:zinc ribbon domain-containing protein n=1 Tax=Nitrososphaera sp. TaxID=1971748 RepID=UPI001795E3E3|nr:zinc ribbon domain-containing protein [Nitrososphaera sp.]NWG37726.1 zinc ribbon domain-containing protein [Nitrososphaera sp.]